VQVRVKISGHKTLSRHSHRQCCQIQGNDWKPLWREHLLFGQWVCSRVLLYLWRKNAY